MDIFAQILDNVFAQFAVVLALSSLFGYLVLRLNLPLVVAYLVAGVSLSLVSHFDPHTLGIFKFLPDLGIAFVLFLIGMELDLREMRALGKPVIFASLGQIIISTLAGYAIAGLLGVDQTIGVYVGLGLSFSSTLVVIKLLLDKRDLASLYGKLSLGILLIEDLVAIIALMLISLSSNFSFGSASFFVPLLVLAGKAVILFALTFVLSRYILEHIFDAIAKSVELLFLTAITWCFVFITVAMLLDFSVVIGAFLAGVALASSPYHLQIQGKIKPLRDFFVTMFFVYLGTEIKVLDVASTWHLILALTAYAIIIKPLIYILILGIFGFRKHTLFQTGLNLSQISEFSLVVILVGVEHGVLPQVILSVMAMVAVVSIILSSILISHSKRLYRMFSFLLPFFEHATKVHYLESKVEKQLEDHVIIIGAHRLGGPVVDYLTRQKIDFVVVDFNPHIVEELRRKGVNIIYGDASDPEILENIQLEKSRLIISTASDIVDNEFLLLECRRKRVGAKIIVRAQNSENAKELKRMGADFIIMPEQVSGDFLALQLKHHWPNTNFTGLG